ncbi:histidinol-phosphate transaminase [Floccifex sp.]|uniref:histidinol-phosphate transaminase n=1 Tax=Floccifex sp. TaxID=2815810 RepID=UPI002A7552D0|nr:histidinol-phosphate transaminase [Floccifex sp.]MDD7281551.1 histidinol-phosphate transaminase [Erysipelotrichaceae bacterium]MDY2957512.1 histidinol-phosphate transaminase [Floccifex sp.]
MKKIESYQTNTSKGILLNANEVSDNLSQQIKEEIKKGIDSIAFNRYPDTDCVELRKKYGQYINISYEQILCGNGSDQMLDLIMSYYLGPDKTMLTLSPDFGMYDYYASRYGANILKFKCEKDGSFDIDEFIDYAKKQKVDLVIFSNPNNPTGHYLDNSQILKIVEALQDIPFIDDEAYIEFACESMIQYVNQYNNFYVTRTLSKVFGLAAIRTGFLIGSKQNIEILSKIKVPYALNSISQMIAVVALNHIDEVMERIEPIKERRNQLMNAEYKDIIVYPSSANFVMVTCSNISYLKQLFENRKVIIRTYVDCDYVRITIGNEEELQIILDVFDQYERDTI